MIITQDFILKAITQVKCREIKTIIGRDRLKFSYEDIGFYLYCIFKHNFEQKTFFSIYKKDKDLNRIITYQGFMKNIVLFSPLIKFLFSEINKANKVRPSNLLNIIDSTLIPEKNSNFITQSDWNKARVTTRTKNKEKIHICGSKAFVLLNRNNQIYHAELCPINDSDQNYLKDKTCLKSLFKGVLLADRGFSNKSVRDRFKANKNDIFNYEEQVCRFILTQLV